MKKTIKLLLLLIILWGCGAQTEAVNLEKDGSIYRYGDVLSFYYPKGWNVSKDEIKLSLAINDPISSMSLYFDAYSYVEENPKEQMLELYLYELETHSIEILSYRDDVLSSGYDCYVIEGKNNRNDTYFFEVVTYLNNKQYVYSFVAYEGDYDKNLKTMELYIYSLNIENFINE